MMKIKKTFGLIFAFVFVTSMFLGTSATALGGGNVESSLMKVKYVTIINPADGATVSGTVTITIDATQTPTIYIDGVSVGRVYSYSWDTTSYTDGSHTIRATISGRSDTNVVTVNNGGGTNNAPIVTITAPSNGATVLGTTTISVSVSDEDTIVPDIYIDATWVAKAYNYNWDTTAFADGSHSVYATATDTGGLTGDDTNAVTVDNGGGSQGWDKATLPHIMPWWNDVIDVEKTSYTGAGTVVVIVDTGLVSNWLDYFPQENILTEYCRSYTQSLGLDNVAYDEDTEGHGTACTATIIGYRLDTTTDYWIEGVAEDAKIIMLRSVYWIGGGVTETTMLNNWADCIDYARSLKAGALSGYNMIVSMSLGYDNTNTALTNAVANAENAGIVVVTSAGNDGPSPDTTAYPANLADTTSVAAAGYVGLTDAYGIDGIGTDIPENDFSNVFVSDFSSRGKVDVTGIGENTVLPYYGGYYYMSGTSFSCPQTAGVYALMFDAFGAQSVAWLEGHLQDTCVDIGYDATTQGAGFIQADGATA
ncbi:MAG: S8 family serine peptidase [Candidatus Thorarchaeota archaeon]|nr:S8 family serine peptidase [Candidatus Thorarchaeota archaeon]